jgi:C1A family cysteine protease
VSRIAPFLACALVLAPSLVVAQGAILEDWTTLNTPPPPATRGVAALPASFTLAGKLPAVRSQGGTGTCTSWSTTYAAASLAFRNLNPNIVLSPAFTYNQVSGDRYCQSGTNASKTLDLLKAVGALPIDEFAFDGGYCGRMPTPDELRRAAAYRIRAYSAFDANNVDLVKQQLVQGAAVIFGMRSSPALRGLRGDKVLDSDEANGEGHAMVAIGYDDAKKAIQIQNSWGKGWGTDGIGWFSWDLWKLRVKSAFVILP